MFEEVTIIGHVGQFDHTAQLKLAPTSGIAGGAERGRKFGRFGVPLKLSRTEGFQLLRKRAISHVAFVFYFGDFLVDPLEGCAKRLGQSINGLLPRDQITLGSLLKLPQASFGQLQKGRIVGLKRFGGKRFEVGQQPLLRLA